VSRAKLASMARQAGLKVTERTLRYWAFRGLIPRPTLVGGRAYYPTSMIEELRMIEPLRRKSVEEIGSILRGEAPRFNYEVARRDGVITIRVKPRRRQDGLGSVSKEAGS